MLVHVHINIVDNINVTDVVNHFVNRKDRCKQTFGHFSQNYIYKIIKLTPRYFHTFIFVYIPYQVYEMWNCVTFYHSLPNDNRISTS